MFVTTYRFGNEETYAHLQLHDGHGQSGAESLGFGSEVLGMLTPWPVV